MNFVKNLFNNRIVKNSLVLINGTVISQMINIILSPFMSRLFSPEAFGKYSSINAAVVLLAVIANGKYDLAIMNSKENDSNRKSIYYGSMFLTIVCCILILIFGFILNKYTTILDSYSLIDILFISLFTFFASNNSIINIWLNKGGYYKQIARNRMIYAFVHAFGIIIFGLIGMSYIGILLSVLLAYITQCLYTYIFLYKNTNFKEYKFDFMDVKLQLKNNLAFPKYQMPSLLLNNSSTQLPIILFTKLFSETVSGWYSMTIKIINLPMQVVGNSLGEIYFKEASEIKAHDDNERLKIFTYNTFKKLMILGVIPMTLLFSYGDILFKFVLGADWEAAGVYSMYLAPWYYIVFITSPFTHLFTVLKKQKSNLVLNIIMLLSRVFAIVGGYLVFGTNVNNTVLIFALTGFVLWLCTNGYLFKMIGITYRKTILQPLFLFTILGVVLYLPRILFNF